MQLEDVKKFYDENLGVKSTIQGKTVKFHVDEMNGDGLLVLNSVYVQDKNVDMKMKRSGTGITVLTTLDR